MSEIKYYEIELKNGKDFIVECNFKVLKDYLIDTCANVEKGEDRIVFLHTDEDKMLMTKFSEIVYIKELSTEEYDKIKEKEELIKKSIDNLIKMQHLSPFGKEAEKDLEDTEFMKFINKLREKKTND